MKPTLLVITALALIPASAQEQQKAKDPFIQKQKPKINTSSEIADTRNLSICYEVFSLSLADAAKLRREGLADSEFYTRLLEAVEKETAVQEHLMLLRTRSGVEVGSSSVLEQIYPTEYEPPELPNTIGLAFTHDVGEDDPIPTPDATKLKNAPTPGSLAGIITPATPTSFETRNVGDSVQVEATLSGDSGIVDIQVQPEHVVMLGTSHAGQGFAETQMPLFAHNSLVAGLTARLGKPLLLGSLNTATEKAPDDVSAKRISFAFVTVDLQKP